MPACRRESTVEDCSDVLQNVANLRSGVIKALRAVHDEIANPNSRTTNIDRLSPSAENCQS
jgi:hypothetical protein